MIVPIAKYIPVPPAKYVTSKANTPRNIVMTVVGFVLCFDGMAEAC